MWASKQAIRALESDIAYERNRYYKLLDRMYALENYLKIDFQEETTRPSHYEPQGHTPRQST